MLLVYVYGDQIHNKQIVSFEYKIQKNVYHKTWKVENFFKQFTNLFTEQMSTQSKNKSLSLTYIITLT